MWAFMRVGCLPFPRLSDSCSCLEGHGRRWCGWLSWRLLGGVLPVGA